VALALFGTVIGLLVAPPVQAGVGPFDVSLQVRPSLRSDTLIRLPPLGTIRLDTHRAPLQLQARVEELRLDEAEAIARDPAVLLQFEGNVAREVGSALGGAARRAALAATLGGLAGALLGGRRWRSLAAGAGAVAVVVAGTALAVARTWEPAALQEPRYTGLLTIAPRAVGDIEAIVQRFGQYRAQLADLVGNLVSLYGVGQALPTFDPARATTRLLHVSDIHLNPQAFDLIARIVDEFSVDAVVDTGDLTDWGSEPESRILDEIGRLPVPYVWVRGNHDSRRTQEAVAAQPNAVVLDGDTVEVAGLRMWGFGDPRYTPDKSGETGRDVEREQAALWAPQVADLLRADQPPGVDLVAVHDARLAAEIGDLTPIVLAGHTHAPRQTQIGGALLLVEGSTGGGGLRAVEGGGPPEPLTTSVLYFDPVTKALVAYDRITVDGIGRTGARIERHLVRP
jgi:predicted phosphodiesterase/outer membrane lipoprotein SlyB